MVKNLHLFIPSHSEVPSIHYHNLWCAMDSVQCVGSNAAELLQAQKALWSHILNYVGSMSLKCAVELGIPDAIHHHTRPITLSELSAALSLPGSKTSHLRRLMRLLTHNGVFSSRSTGRRDDVGDDEEEEDVYLLTPISRLLVTTGRGGGLSPFLLLSLDPVGLAPFQFMAAWFKGDSPSPFSMAHGRGFWDENKDNPVFNTTFNAGMASDSSFLMDFLVGECGGDVFLGLRSLVDVGGGTGAAAKAIAKAFPLVKCSVLELPQVVETVREQGGGVDFIAGDMFESVPPADAILLKWILHNWNDEDCVKILRRCKEAIPTREEGGKVIVVDMVVGSKNSHPKSRETQLHFDMLMFVLINAYEREEDEWRKIFVAAGFTDYKITPGLGLRSIIEVYP